MLTASGGPIPLYDPLARRRFELGAIVLAKTGIERGFLPVETGGEGWKIQSWNPSPPTLLRDSEWTGPCSIMGTLVVLYCHRTQNTGTR